MTKSSLHTSEVSEDDGETEDALDIRDNSEFELELENELKDAMPKKTLPRRSMRRVADEQDDNYDDGEADPTAIVEDHDADEIQSEKPEQVLINVNFYLKFKAFSALYCT